MIEYENLRLTNKPFYELYKAKFNQVLEKGWFVLGEEVKEFEKSFADYCGSQYAIGVANGFDALVLSISALDLPANSEIVVPSNTYIATIFAILKAGHIPVPVEPAIDTYTIDTNLLSSVISKNTRALLVVHLYGKPCKMDLVTSFCIKNDLFLIEDCAQAHGAMFQNKKVGTFGIGAFSFYPTKNLGALGDGGAIITSDYELMHKLKLLRNYGSGEKHYHTLPGYNSRLDEVQAAFLTIKLAYLDAINQHKQALASIYQAGISDNFIKPVLEANVKDVYHIYTIRHPKRDIIKKYLEKKGIKCEIHYPVPPHKQKALEGIWNKYHLPVSEKIHNTCLSLPISYATTKEEAEYVVETLNRF